MAGLPEKRFSTVVKIETGPKKERPNSFGQRSLVKLMHEGSGRGGMELALRLHALWDVEV